MVSQSNYPLRLGELKDAAMERDFAEQEVESSLSYIRPLLWVFALLYLGFLIPDWQLNTVAVTRWTVIAHRVGLVLLLIPLYRLTYTLDRLADLRRYFTIYQLIMGLSFLHIFSIYENPNLLIQSSGLVVAIIIIFFFPNRWIHMVSVATFLTAAFLLTANTRFPEATIQDFLASFAFISIVLLLNAVNSLRINAYKRLQYVESQKLRTLSQSDPLTGTFNRFHFNEMVPKLVEQARADTTNLSITIMDIDDFKHVNDAHGHLIGDEVLHQLTDLIRGNIRTADQLYRWGGDEFVIVMPRTAEHKAWELVDRLRSIIENTTFTDGSQITCSFGVVAVEADDTLQSLLRRVDGRLFHAKRQGKNVVL